MSESLVLYQRGNLFGATDLGSKIHAIVGFEPLKCKYQQCVMFTNVDESRMCHTGFRNIDEPEFDPDGEVAITP